LEDRELRKAGLKVTSSRLKVLKILEHAEPHHMSAEDVYRKLLDTGDDVSLATIYRVLTQFEAAGLVVRHNFSGGYSVFELNQGEHHDHLVCLQCGKVIEFVDEVIEQRQDAIAVQSGFKITDHSHTIYGACAACQKKE